MLNFLTGIVGFLFLLCGAFSIMCRAPNQHGEGAFASGLIQPFADRGTFITAATLILLLGCARFLL